ncbi:hypothetical protein LXA43DRAFT_659534 [Ganoderma leucocontextum]|nr:hypothetical protein LXA43DRAFT_659534 [Ganoderma leucocontextum]
MNLLQMMAPSVLYTPTTSRRLSCHAPHLTELAILRPPPDGEPAVGTLPAMYHEWNNGRPIWRSSMSSDHEPDPAHRPRSLLPSSRGTRRRRDIWFQRVQDVVALRHVLPSPAAACIQEDRGHAPQGLRSDTSSIRPVSRRLRLASDPTGSAVLPWRFRGGSRPDQIVDPVCLPRQVQLRHKRTRQAGVLVVRTRNRVRLLPSGVKMWQASVPHKTEIIAGAAASIRSRCNPLRSQHRQAGGLC